MFTHITHGTLCLTQAFAFMLIVIPLFKHVFQGYASELYPTLEMECDVMSECLYKARQCFDHVIYVCMCILRTESSVCRVRFNHT